MNKPNVIDEMISFTLLSVCENALGQAIKEGELRGVQVDDRHIVSAVVALAVTYLAKAYSEAEWLRVLNGILGVESQAAMRAAHRAFRESKGAPVDLLENAADSPAWDNAN